MQKKADGFKKHSNKTRIVGYRRKKKVYLPSKQKQF